jgi:pSer/pThr/pTyr-binding forkhead associated (FHA) protein
VATQDAPVKLIIVEDGMRTALEFDKPEISIGRAIDNDIRLSGAHASRHHCKIEQGKETWIHDLGSANGIQINGTKVEKKELREGDVLAIGGARLYVEKLGTGADPSRTQRIDPGQASGAPPIPAALPDFGVGGFDTHAGDERRDLERLGTFARVTKALLSETELSALLRLIVDSALALVGGEHRRWAQLQCPSH